MYIIHIYDIDVDIYIKHMFTQLYDLCIFIYTKVHKLKQQQLLDNKMKIQDLPRTTRTTARARTITLDATRPDFVFSNK